MKKISYLVLLISAFFLCVRAEGRNLSHEEQLVRVGIGAYNDGFYDIAEKQFSQFLREFPTHKSASEISYLLGKTCLDRGKIKEAKRLFSRILNDGKNFEFVDYAFFWAAEIEVKLGNGEEARRLLLSLANRFPKFEWIDNVYFRLGLLDVEANRLSSAESSFKKVLALSKRDEVIRPSWFWLGILFYRQKNHEEAARYFKSVGEDPRLVSQTYQRYALFWLCETQLQMGRFGEARSTCKMFTDRFREDTLSAQIHWRLGFCEYRLGNSHDSVQIFRSFLKESKDIEMVYLTQYLLGEILLINGDYASSAKEMTLLLAKDQGNGLWGAGAIILYWNHLHLGEIDGANKIFQRLQRLNHSEDDKLFVQWLNAEITFSEGKVADALPYYFNLVNSKYRQRALFQIGKGYFFENKFREAITNLDILLLEFPDSNAAEECLFLKGECLSKLGEVDQALETYGLVTRQNRMTHWRLFALTQTGSLYSLRNEQEKAEEAFKRAIQDFPDHSLFYHAALQLANLNFKKKDIAEALYYYSIVLKANTLELLGEAYFALGEIFYQQGKDEKAFKHFEAAISHLKETSPWFFLTQLEIGNLQRKWERYEEARKSFRIVLDRSEDEEIKRAAKELLNHVESH